ncbi:unnamed protein product [Enterobius vermicularis]|uniref:CHK domain-containing protein n=1 Tax=Enterobius vermicularis TaxID=51028 RepID=A0A0N4VKU6_ENTVE|nr:unnamed protein product [Enterobius vermicularis]
MELPELIAPSLGLNDGEKPSVDFICLTSNGVTNFRLKAAFYNAKYLYEVIKYDKVPVKVGKFEKELKIEDQGEVYSLFITVRKPGLRTTQTLQLDQLFQVAEQLSSLHAFCLSTASAETKKVIDGNYSKIKQYRLQKTGRNIAKDVQVIVSNYSAYFKGAAHLAEKVQTIFKSEDDLLPPVSLGSSLTPSVMCHGELSSEKIVFSEGNIAEITGWDNLHYGSVAEDLSYLIITSAPPEIRRRRYMSVFRRYFYKLVDSVPLTFKLSDLKDAFKKMHKSIVLGSTSGLIRVLETNDEEEKLRQAERWETALDDAIAIENDDYPSDNEDAFFAN